MRQKSDGSHLKYKLLKDKKKETRRVFNCNTINENNNESISRKVFF